MQRWHMTLQKLLFKKDWSVKENDPQQPYGEAMTNKMNERMMERAERIWDESCDADGSELIKAIAQALLQVRKETIEECAKVSEDMTKEQEYKTIGHLCDNRCEWEREWTKGVVASAIRQLAEGEVG